jgi:hypothetical protein
LNPTHILKHVATSAANAEIGAAFVNCKEAIPIRITLGEMGHTQLPTWVTLDNTTAVGFVNKQMKQRRTKAIIDMRYCWLQDQEAQEHFSFQWDKGENNRADYFTNHHPPAHHQLVQQQYVSNCRTYPTGTKAKDQNGDTTEGTHSKHLHPLRGCADPGSNHWTYDGQTRPGCATLASQALATPMTNGHARSGPTDIPQITQTLTLNKLIYYSSHVIRHRFVILTLALFPLPR